MTTIAHLTDLHFGRSLTPVVEALHGELCRLRPQFVVVTGDLTQRAARAEFQAAADFLGRLPNRVIVVPGNHDIPGFKFWLRALRPYARYRRYISAELEPRYADQRIVIAGLNSARRAVPHWNWALGRASTTQLQRLESFFATAPAGALRVVGLHHPLVSFGRDASQRRVLGAPRLVDALDTAGVDLVLTGHSHHNRVFALRRHYAGRRNTLVVQSSTATSSRQREHPNAFALIHHAGGALTVTHRCWNGESFEAGAPANHALDASLQR